VQAYGVPGTDASQMSVWRSLGQFYYDIGRVEVRYVHDTTATATVLELCDALNAGDVLIPFEERPMPEYKPSEKFNRFEQPTGRAQGRVVMGKEFNHMVALGDIIYVNLGSSQGVKAGDYVRLYRPATGTAYHGYDRMGQGQLRRQRGMPQGYEIPKMRQDLPREVLGEAFVVRVDEYSAVALVTLSLREIHAGDFAELE